MWSSRTTQPYMSLTIHFIKGWELKSRCLQTSYFPEDHTGEMIALNLREALESWGLPEAHQVCVTTDNATNNVKALQLNDWTRLQCFGHRLHLAIERSVKEPQVERAIGVCKKVVSAFCNSWKRKRELATAQAELGLPAHQLITETPTRWGSRQQMIERILEQEKALTQVLRADRKTRHLVLTWQDIDVLESVSKALSPLVAFTDALSGEQYVSVSYLKPVLHLFSEQVLKPQDDDVNLTKKIKASILEYLDEKYADPSTQDLLDMASLLDPRFKITYIKPEKVDYIKTKTAAEIESLVAEQEMSAGGDSIPPAEAATEVPENPAKKKRSLGSFFKIASRQDQTVPQSGRQSIELELNRYLQTVEADGETNPLEWWRQHEANFPRVASLAKKYLCIQATSAPSERAFSTSGNIITCRRSALKPERVNQLVFLAHNL
ncbi:Zinc finger BED domain-containing protein 1 [Merluccius polli]|uniref:Zinc finger BED domain-containing protein 1 n=1 Tax=Merluccius polli TaxID=89951 RepID=A0AA47PAU4_MERPO|nr:Zinc finger BED domain-containing protein 1 [Merluccius polli]